jgi:hypothetical protein
MGEQVNDPVRGLSQSPVLLMGMFYDCLVPIILTHIAYMMRVVKLGLFSCGGKGRGEPAPYLVRGWGHDHWLSH